MPLPPIVMRRMTPEIVGTSMLAQGNVSSLANKKGHRQVAFSYNRYLRFRRINRMRAAATTTAPNGSAVKIYAQKYLQTPAE